MPPLTLFPVSSTTRTPSRLWPYLWNCVDSFSLDYYLTTLPLVMRRIPTLLHCLNYTTSVIVQSTIFATCLKPSLFLPGSDYQAQMQCVLQQCLCYYSSLAHNQGRGVLVERRDCVSLTQLRKWRWIGPFCQEEGASCFSFTTHATLQDL